MTPTTKTKTVTTTYVTFPLDAPVTTADTVVHRVMVEYKEHSTDGKYWTDMVPHIVGRKLTSKGKEDMRGGVSNLYTHYIEALVIAWSLLSDNNFTDLAKAAWAALEREALQMLRDSGNQDTSPEAVADMCDRYAKRFSAPFNKATHETTNKPVR